MISKYDKIIVGLLTAFAVAFVAYALLLQLEEFMSNAYAGFSAFNERSLALLAICLNVVPMNYFRRRYHNKSLRGLVIGTMLLAGIWFYQFGSDLMNG